VAWCLSWGCWGLGKNMSLAEKQLLKVAEWGEGLVCLP
jgi:hypothetical protein